MQQQKNELRLSLFGGKSRTLKEVLVDRIVIDRDNPRKEIDTEDESILNTGLEINPTIQVPLIVEQTSEDPDYGSLVLIDGERRYRAAVKAGMKTVFCDVRPPMSRTERNIIRAIVQFQRKPWSEADTIKFVMDLYKDWLKVKHDEVPGMASANKRKEEFRQIIGISRGVLDQMLAADNSEIAMQMIDRGDSLDSVSRATMGLKDPKNITRVVEMAKQIDKELPPNKRVEISTRGHVKGGRRSSNAQLPGKQVTHMAKKIVQREEEDNPKKRDQMALKDIINWMDELAKFYPSINRSMKDINNIDSMRKIIGRIQSHVDAYSGLIRTAEAAFPTLHKGKAKGD